MTARELLRLVPDAEMVPRTLVRKVFFEETKCYILYNYIYNIYDDIFIYMMIYIYVFNYILYIICIIYYIYVYHVLYMVDNYLVQGC